MITRLKEIYSYRELLKTSIKKEIRGKYKGSFLGVLWSFINPLLMVLVYAIVFPFIMRSSMPHYLQFLITGIIPWTFFTTTLVQGVGTIKNNAGILKKVYFPREILPLSVSFSGLINFFISCIIIVIFCLFGGLGISWHLIFVPLVGFIQFLFTLGIVMALTAINAYIQDTEYIINFFINMLFYGTPILYPEAQIIDSGAPAFLVILVKLNPFTHFMRIYRDIFLNHCIPSFSSIAYVAVVAVILVIIGYLIFRKLEKGFAEVL